MNGSSVVDYLLLDYNDFGCFTHFCILLPNSFSDHCGIEINLAKKNRLENNRKAYTNVTNDTFIQWDKAKINDFSTLLSSKINEFAQLENLLQDPYCDTDSISRSLSEILVECSHSVFGCTRLSRNNSYQQCKKKYLV